MKRILAAAVAVLLTVGVLGACSSVEEPEIAPIQEFSSEDEMSEVLGFPMVALDMSGYTPKNYQVLEGELGQIIYENEKGLKLRFRMQKTNDDICGFEETKDGGMHQVGKSKIWFGMHGNMRIAQWGQDGYTYCLVGEGFERAPFRKAINFLEQKINPPKTIEKLS